MSIELINWALKVKTGSPTTKLVLLKLADQANDDGQCWPSQRTIADQCEINRSTVNRHIKRLEELGFLKIIARSKDGVSLPNMYELIGVGAQEHSGGRTGAQGVGAQEHTNHHIEPPIEPPKRPTTFKRWIDSIPDGEEAIPADHSIFTYAEKVGIPHDYLELAWRWFEKTYTIERSAKKYTDWPKVFRNSIEGNWGNIWAINRSGEYFLTTTGQQFERSRSNSHG